MPALHSMPSMRARETLTRRCPLADPACLSSYQSSSALSLSAGAATAAFLLGRCRPYFAAIPGCCSVSHTTILPLAPPAASRNGDSGQKAAAKMAPALRSFAASSFGSPVLRSQSFACGCRAKVGEARVTPPY